MTVLIKNVQILGGARKYDAPKDIFISGKRISAIGNFGNKKADEVLDGTGSYCSPGFIDLHTTSDHYLSLFEYPLQGDFLLQGVTTTLGGHCGVSLAPFLGNREHIRRWADPNRLNINWQSFGEFISALKRQKLGVHFGSLVGYEALGISAFAKASADKQKSRLHLLEKSMSEGAYGISFNLEYRKEHPISYAELKGFAQVIAPRKGIIGLHLRNGKEGIKKSFEETWKLAKETKATIIISHFLPEKSFEENYRTALKRLLNEYHSIYFGIYPFTRGMFPLSHFLPEWAQDVPKNEFLRALRNEKTVERITKEMKEITPTEFVIAEASHNQPLVGKNLAELMLLYGMKDWRMAFLKLVETTSLNAIIFYHYASQEMLTEAFFHPRALITSVAPSFTPAPTNRLWGFVSRLKHERSINTFPTFLRYAKNNGDVSLENAVYKITKLPARLLGLENRGEIKEGACADLAVWSENKDEINPHTKGFGGGVKVWHTLVEGVVAVKDAALTGRTAGNVLSRI